MTTTHHREGASVQETAPDCGGYTFRAPRHEDLKQCPVCGTTPDDFGACDHCGSEGRVFKDLNYDA